MSGEATGSKTLAANAMVTVATGNEIAVERMQGLTLRESNWRRGATKS
jgi:hypothetical protein